MKLDVRYQPLARQDLVDQAVYLAEQASIETADRFLDSAKQTLAHLAEMPRVGRVWQGLRSETRDQIRVWQVEGFPKILVFYRLEATSITVVRVLHSARDLPSALEDSL